eukprot:2119434-Amphidinium_carterae.5
MGEGIVCSAWRGCNRGPLEVLHRYATKREYLLEIDSSFVIEEKILQYATEGGAREKLQEKLLSALPTEQTNSELDKVALGTPCGLSSCSRLEIELFSPLARRFWQGCGAHSRSHSLP